MDTLRFETFSGQAKALLADDRYEEALRIYDRALELRSDATLSAEHALVSLYIDALSRWRLQLRGQTVQYLGQTTRRGPIFSTSASGWRSHTKSWANSLGRDGQWCEAVNQYKAALNFGAAADVASKQADGVEFCANPPTPTVSAEAGATTSPPGHW